MKSDKGLAPQVNALDSAAFQRVWSRVTAGQEHSPIAVSSAAAPSAPPEDALALWIDRLAQAVGDDLALARRWPGAAARAACANVNRLRPLLRRLDTAYFLLTGRRYRPASAAASLPIFPRDQALRLRWLRLREWSEQLSGDGLPPELSQELAAQLAAAGEELYALLECLSPM